MFATDRSSQRFAYSCILVSHLSGPCEALGDGVRDDERYDGGHKGDAGEVFELLQRRKLIEARELRRGKTGGNRSYDVHSENTSQIDFTCLLSPIFALCRVRLFFCCNFGGKGVKCTFTEDSARK